MPVPAIFMVKRLQMSDFFCNFAVGSVYDMNGGEIAAYPLSSFGNGELTIDGGTFRAGMYLYALIADGQLIDTKQMILTK